MILLEYQNIKTFLEKTMFLIGFKTFLGLKKVTVSWTYIISDLKGKEIVATFYEKELQKPNQEFRAESNKEKS